jgi:hypothetical protein
MPANIQPPSPSTEGRTTLVDRLEQRVLNWGRSWLMRQVLKLIAAVCTIVTAYLHGKGFDDDTITKITVGIAAAITGGSEILWSFIQMRFAKKALPVN